MDYEILQKDPPFWHNQTNEIYCLMGRLGQLGLLNTHTHACHISMYFLVITYYFIVICTFVSYFALRISIERDLYDMWSIFFENQFTNSLTRHSPLSWSSEICKPNLLHSSYVAPIHSTLSYNPLLPQDTTSDSHIEELESNHSN